MDGNLSCTRLRYYPPEKQGLRPPSANLGSNQRTLRYYPPEKQGLRRRFGRPLCGGLAAQILSSRKTRIKTPQVFAVRPRLYPQILSSRKTRIKTFNLKWIWHFFSLLRYYPPEKQGLRLIFFVSRVEFETLRYYPPEKQGLRPDSHPQKFLKFFSDTILQKNKD